MTIVNQSTIGATERQKRFDQQSVLLDPGISRCVGLGAYNKTEAIPNFTLKFEPENMQEGVDVSFEHMDIPGKARTLYMCRLNNKGDRRCRVTIALQERNKNRHG